MKPSTRPSGPAPRSDDTLPRERTQTNDPPSPEPQTPHPLGVGGAIGGAAAGALGGVAAGPVGSVAGAVVGAALGAAGAAKSSGASPSTPGPQTPEVRLTPRQRELAIQYGVKARSRLGPGAQWSDAEPSLRAGWSALEATTQLGWEQARATVEEGSSLRGSHQRR
jgi:hypothetical protein